MLEQNHNQGKDYSVDALVNWLDYAISKGLLNRATTTSRKSAVLEVLVNSGIFDDSEKKDVRKLNSDETFTRYIHLNSKKYTPVTLNNYKSRIKNAIEVFVRYTDNPLGFSVNTPKQKKANTPKPSSKPNTETQRALIVPPKDEATNEVKTFDLPVPIRDGDHMVIISNIPKDIQEEDIKRISAVIRAYSNE